MVFLLSSGSLQYQVEKLKNPLLPINLGNSYIVNNYHHVYYHINLTNMETSILVTKTTLLSVIDKLKNQTTNLDGLLTIRANNLLDQTNSIEQFINHYTTKRHRRGLLNIIGKTHKYLYGTLDADDGERYDKYIKTLRNNQDILQKGISNTQTILKKLTQDIDSQLTDINQNQKKIQQKINDLIAISETTIHIILLIDNIENNIHILNEIRNNIQTAINFAEINIMHHSILEYEELRRIITHLKNQERIPFDNIIKYYEVAHVDVTIKNNLIIFYIAIPLIINKPYVMYQNYPIPINNHIMILKNPYILISSNDYFNINKKCQKIEELNLCLETDLSKIEPCIANTINLLEDHCPLTPIYYNKTSITQLADNSIIILPATSEKITFQCPTQQTIEDIKEPSLIIPQQCMVNINNKYYESQKLDTINLRLKLPAININEKLIQSIEPLMLNEINLNSIHDDLDHIETLNIHTLQDLDVDNNISIMDILIIILIIIIIVFVIYYYCKIKNKVKVGIKLKDLKLDTFKKDKPFSQT